MKLNLKALRGNAHDREVAGERRKQERYITILRVALIHAGDAKELCVVRNISAGGLSARVYRRFEVGEAVEVEFRSEERLVGIVKWVRGFEIGISFAEAIEVDAVLVSRWASEDGRKQRLPRVELQCRCQLRIGSRFYLATLQDISQGGAKLLLARPAEGTADAILTLPDLGWLEGSLRWTHGATVGISFNERLPFEVLVHWIQGRREIARESLVSETLAPERAAA
jgi:hypothetical protein